MKAFFGHSFAEKDKDFILRVKKFFSSHDVECVDGEKAQNSSVAEKIKERMSECDLFVGIFTKGFSYKKKCFSEKLYTTSSWVVQESGFAIGQAKEVILLVEKGIGDFPELQGDLELIYFERGRVDELFQRIAEMLNRSKAPALVTSNSLKTTESLVETTQEVLALKVIEGVPTGEDGLMKYFKAHSEVKDPDELKELFDKEVEPTLKDADKIIWKAVNLRHLHELGRHSAFGDLLDLFSANNDNNMVARQIAIRYDSIREYGKAVEYYKIAADLAKQAGELSTSYELLAEASQAMLNQGLYEDALGLLKEYLLLGQDDRLNYILYSGMATLAAMQKDDIGFKLYAEAALHADPSDTQLRFKLAYAYSQDKVQDFSKLAVLHYRKLLNIDSDHSVALNNLGVEYGSLKLSGKSTDAFSRSAALKNTLAMSNLANNYVQAGFFELAAAEIEKANRLSADGVEVHGNVGVTANQLKRMTEEEDASVEQILLEAERERVFRLDQSRRYLSASSFGLTELEGEWESTHWGLLDFKIVEGQLVAEKKMAVKVEEGGTKKYKKVKIQIGLTGAVGTFEVKIHSVTEWSLIPNSEYLDRQESGIMLVEQDGLSLRLLFKSTKGNYEEVWRKKTNEPED